VIPIGSRNDRPDYDYSDGVTLHVYQLEDGKSVQVEIPSIDGKIETTFQVTRHRNEIRVQRQGGSKKWSVCLHDHDHALTTEAGEADKQIIVRVP
jgi:alpha-D-xyloside xylohydrolase